MGDAEIIKPSDSCLFGRLEFVGTVAEVGFSALRARTTDRRVCTMKAFSFCYRRKHNLTFVQLH